VSNEGAPSPFFLSVRVADISATCEMGVRENFRRTQVFKRDLERAKRWGEQEKDAIVENPVEPGGVGNSSSLESCIDAYTPSFFTEKGAFFRLQVQSRNFGQQSLALTVKARMQPFCLYITQRTLAFLCEFKRVALPPAPESAVVEQKPIVNVWTESVFDEVRILPLKLTFSYHPQVGAPVPVFEEASGYKWILMLAPSIKATQTHTEDFHFVAPKGRPVPLSILKDHLIASYTPSARNILDIAGSLGPVQLMVNFFKNTVKIVHAHKSDVPDESETALSRISSGLNSVAVETIDLGGQSFLAVVRLLHWVDRTVSCGDGEAQTITTPEHTPMTIGDGFRNAGAALLQGFSTAIDGVVRMPVSAYYNSGFLSSLATFTRNIPGVVIRPVVGVGDALLNVIFSVRNVMSPAHYFRDLRPYAANPSGEESESSESVNTSSTEPVPFSALKSSTKQ